MNKYRKSPILLVQDTVMPKIVGGFTNSATDRSEKGADMIHINQYQVQKKAMQKMNLELSIFFAI